LGSASEFTCAYHQSANGLVERQNKTIADCVSMYIEENDIHRDWDKYVYQLASVYNKSPQATTRISPFELLYGRKAVFPTEIELVRPEANNASIQKKLDHHLRQLKTARENILAKQKIDKQIFDSHHRAVEYSENSQVLVYIPSRKVGLSEKLLHYYQGPATILRKLDEVNYLVRFESGKEERVHVIRLRPFRAREEE
jgi:N-acetylneuraminic acid mutarotase